ncbi:MAG: DUF1559 domain-containing protein [Planctomycetaceae bacterium]|nr:DUF1559 domain-containing protein [Planctomycetaceae bacterium]
MFSLLGDSVMRFASLKLLSLFFAGVFLVGCSSDEPAPSSTPENASVESAAPEEITEAPAPPSIEIDTTTSPETPTTVETPTTAESVATAENPLDLSYITDDFTSALILHPSRMLASPFVTSLKEAGVPISQGLDEMIAESGIDPNTIAQLIVLGDKDSTQAASMMGPGFFGFGGGPPPEFVPEAKPEAAPDQSAVERDHRELQPVNFQPAAGAFEAEDAQGGHGPGPMGPRPIPTVIIRLTESVDPKSFFDEKPIPPLEDAEVDGLAVKKIPDPNLDGVIHFADDKTVIFTKPTLLKKMMAAKGGNSPLVTELQQVEASNDIILVIDMSPLRDLIAGLGAFMAMGQEGGPDPNLALGLKVVSELKTLTITAGITSDSLLSISLVGESAETMTEANQKLDELAQMGRGLYQMQKPGLMQAESPLAESDKQSLLAVADEVVAGITNKVEGTRLTVSVPKPEKLNDLPDILKPMIGQAQNAQVRMQKKNNLKMIGLAFHNYHDVNNGFPGAGSDFSGEKQGLSWRVHLLPFLDQQALYSQFHLDESWDSEHNASLIAQMPDVFKSPEVTEEGKTAFQLFVGKGAAFEGDKGLAFRDFTDGTSNTILTMETSPEKAEYWTKPGGIPFDEEKLLDYFQTPYDYGFLYGRVDGSVQTVQDLDKKLETFKIMITRNGGEVAPRQW